MGMISGLLSLSVNGYLCTLPMPITKTRSQVVAEIADRTVSQQSIYSKTAGDCYQITSPAVFEILGCKRIGARVWRGYVTSSVTWPFDSP